MFGTQSIHWRCCMFRYEVTEVRNKGTLEAMICSRRPGAPCDLHARQSVSQSRVEAPFYRPFNKDLNILRLCFKIEYGFGVFVLGCIEPDLRLNIKSIIICNINFLRSTQFAPFCTAPNLQVSQNRRVFRQFSSKCCLIFANVDQSLSKLVNCWPNGGRCFAECRQISTRFVYVSM